MVDSRQKGPIGVCNVPNYVENKKKHYCETDEHPNPRQSRVKWHFGTLFPTANNFSWVGIDFILETDYKKPNPTKFSAKTLLIVASFRLAQA